MKQVYSILLAAALPVMATAQFTGEVDSTFGTNGTITYSDANMSREYFYTRIADTANNRLYYVGSTTLGGNFDAYVLCTDLAGSPDANYGNNGVVRVDPSLGGTDIAMCGQMQPDGKLVLGGYTVGSGIDMLLMRLNTDGTLDPSFNGSGIKTYTSAGNNNDVIRDLTIDANGNIVVAGYIKINNNEDMVIARFLPNGDLDITFGNQGLAKLTLANDESFYKITHLANNGYLAAGNSDSKLIVVKIANGGTPDNTFGSNGIVTIVEPNAGLQPNAMIETYNGSIMIGGTAFTNANGPTAYAIKMKANGALDTKFAGSGKYFPPYGSTSNDTVTSGDDLLLMKDGSIFISGTYSDNVVYDIALIKIDSTGNTDLSFGNSGLRRYHADAARRESSAKMTMLSDGSLLLQAQSSTTNAMDMDMMVVKLKAPKNTVGIATANTPGGDWLLYPNPCTQHLSIKRPEGNNQPAHAVIINTQGQVVARIGNDEMKGNTVSLDKYIQNIANGIYMLAVTTGDERFTATFRKQ